MPKEYNATQIEDFLQIEATVECTAKGCKEINVIGMINAPDEAADHLFDDGWRATNDNCYCPKHAKKLLKL